MGVSRSPAELRRKLMKFAVDVSDVSYPATELAAKLIQRNVKSLAPSRMRGVSKTGAKLGVSYNIGRFKRDSGSTVQAKVYATGPFHLIERNTKAHVIVPKKATGIGASRRGRGKNAAELLGVRDSLSGLRGGFGKGATLKIGGIGFRAYVKHPGTRGKHPWQRGVAQSLPDIPHLYESRLDVAMRRF